MNNSIKCFPNWAELDRTGIGYYATQWKPVRHSQLDGPTTGRVSVGYPLKVYVELKKEWVKAELGCQLPLLAADQSAHVGMVSHCGRRGGRDRWPMRTQVAEWQIGRITLKLHLTLRAWMNDKSGRQSTDHNPSVTALVLKVIGSSPCEWFLLDCKYLHAET